MDCRVELRARLLAATATLALLALPGCGGGCGGNAAPRAVNLSIVDSDGANPVPGDELIASYVYADAEGDREDGSVLLWYKNGTPLAGTSGNRYRLSATDVGAEISFAVTPVAATGTPEGKEQPSAPVTVMPYASRIETPAALDSAYTGVTYNLWVRLPDGVETGADRYPVIYMTDAAQRFETTVDILDERGLDVILVAIGSLSAERRWVDFTVPGAYDYYDFLSLELIPAVESSLPVATDRRVLAGHSLGGLLAGLVMLTEPSDSRRFSDFLISDGTFSDQWETTIMLMDELQAAGTGLPATVFGAATENGGTDTNGWFSWMLWDRNYDGLVLTYEEYETDHNNVWVPAFSDGIDTLFPASP